MLLEELNALHSTQLSELLTKCCGSGAWVKKMCSLFPWPDEAAFFRAATSTWYACNEEDWLEAFSHHPEIGDMASLQEKFPSTANLAEGEQSAVKQASQQVLEDLHHANRLYKKKFGYIFIVCATGKSAKEMLQLLEKRLPAKPEDEIKIAMEEQNKITALRLRKLLQS